LAEAGIENCLESKTIGRGEWRQSNYFTAEGNAEHNPEELVGATHADVSCDHAPAAPLIPDSCVIISKAGLPVPL